MSPLLLGLMTASLASALFYGGMALQAGEARTTSRAAAMRLSLVTELMSRGRWLIGTLLVLAGWLLQALALLLAPFTVVQPTLAVGLLLLLAIAAWLLKEPVGRGEVLSVCAICLGVAGLALAGPQRTAVEVGPVTLALVLACVGAVALAIYAVGRLGGTGGLVAACGAGFAYAWAGISTKLASDALAAGSWTALILWVAATAAAAALAILSEMTALQDRPVAQVGPLVIVVDIVVAVGLAPWLTGDRWLATPFDGVPLVASIVVLLAGAATLARSPRVTALMAPAAAASPR